MKIIKSLSSTQYDGDLLLVLASDDNPYKDKESYIRALELEELWPGELEIKIASNILNSTIFVHSRGNIFEYGTENSANESRDNEIYVQYHGNHYNYLKLALGANREEVYAQS